jgi:hypothetical protein
MPTTPVVPSPRWMGMPHSVSLARHHVGGAHLFKAQFGVGVDVAPHGCNARGLGDDGIDDFMP